jgi:hypothetical protein
VENRVCLTGVLPEITVIIINRFDFQDFEKEFQLFYVQKYTSIAIPITFIFQDFEKEFQLFYVQKYSLIAVFLFSFFNILKTILNFFMYRNLHP